MSDAIESATAAPEPIPFRTRMLRLAFRIGLLAVIVLFVFTVLMPWLNQVRDGPGSNRLWCSSNLRQIGLAIKMYANEFGDRYPPSFRELLLHEELTSDVFCCPSSGADRAVGPTTQAIADQLTDANSKACSYYYTADGLSDNAVKEDDILAFEPASNHQDEGFNVLFGDGHVDWFNATGSAKPTYDRLLVDFRAGVRPLRLQASP